MTIAVTVRVNDGVVIASDSAATLSLKDGRVLKVFYNADKIVNLCRGYPIGVVFFGAGSIGPVSLGTVAKDFRRLISSRREYDWAKCRVEELNKRFCGYLEERSTRIPEQERPGLFGFYMAGFSATEDLPELWYTMFENGKVKVTARDTTPWGILYEGMRQPLDRLVYCFDQDLVTLLAEAGIDKATRDQLVSAILAKLQATLVYPSMPIQDAIDLARFLVYTAEWYWRFSPGPAAQVGGPIEIATISKHEGFKWVARKHWFNAAVNPVGGGAYVPLQVPNKTDDKDGGESDSDTEPQ